MFDKNSQKKHCMEVNARYVNQFVIVNVNRSPPKLQHFNCCLVRNEKLRLKLSFLVKLQAGLLIG